MVAPCTWPVARDGCLPADYNPDSPVDVARLQSCIDTAVSILWSFTGRQYGCCQRLIRPCPAPCETSNTTAWIPGLSWYPALEGGVWRNITCSCGPACRVGGPGMVHLPGPVCAVEAVTIDGIDIPTESWTLEGDRLYSNAGEWPSQDLQAPAGSPGTWTVTYGQGWPPPSGAGQMVMMLAGEFWKACQGQACKLPPRVTSVTRRGVSMQMADPVMLFEQPVTGIPEVDMWVAAVNPTRQKAPSRIASPDFPGGAW